MVCDTAGDFHLIELKFTTSKVVALSPHQVSFMAKHKNASVISVSFPVSEFEEEDE